MERAVIRASVFLLMLLLSATSALAWFNRGGSAAICQYTGATTVGSCINFQNSGTLTTTDGGTWQFNSVTNLHVTSAGGFNVGSSSQAVFCKSAGFASGAVAVTTFGVPWSLRVGYPDWQQQITPCVDSSNNFLVNGSGVNSLFDACQTTAAAASIEIKKNPNGAWLGIDPTGGINLGCQIKSSGATFTLDSGASISTPFCCNGAAGIEMDGANQAFSAASASIVGGNFDQGSGINEVLDCVTGNCTNPTIGGTTGNPFTIDCEASHGQLYSDDGATGLLTGPPPSGASIVTLSNFTVKNCGTYTSGQNHGIYLGWGSGSPTLNTAYNEALTNVIVQDSSGDTNALKIDTINGTTAGTITKTSVYCTITTCYVNEPIDFQCGGNHSITNSYFEMYGQTGQTDQWAFSKANWVGSSGCPTSAGPTNNIHFDKVVFVYDGPTAGSYNDPSTGLHKIVLCAAARTGGVQGDCGATGHTTACITNSQIVDNSTDQTELLEAGPSVFVDSGCTGSGPDTNTYYAGAGGGRGFACGVATNWPTDGHNCAFPYVPQYIAQNETHDQLVAQAHAAGRCGEGTRGDPIRDCNYGIRYAAL